MRTSEIFNRIAWIVETVNNHPGITLAELQSRWRRSPLSDFGNSSFTFSRSTFYIDRNSIKASFGIEIATRQSGTKYGLYIVGVSTSDFYITQRLLLGTLMDDIRTSCRDI